MALLQYQIKDFGQGFYVKRMSVIISGVTVLLIPPDPESVNVSCISAEPFEHPVYPKSALKSVDPATVGESWEVSEDPNVERYGGFQF